MGQVHVLHAQSGSRSRSELLLTQHLPVVALTPEARVLLAPHTHQAKQRADRAAGFFGCLTRRDDADAMAESHDAFIGEFGYEPTISMETPSWVVSLDSGPGVEIGTDPTGRITVVLNGESFLEGCTDPRAVASRYLRVGHDFARDLNGTYNLLVVDRVMDRVLMVTDRIASRRLFHGRAAGRHWVGSDLAVLPTRRFRIDAVGVAWYLSNGVPNAGRTPYVGLNALDRSAIHELTTTGVSSSRYWDVGNKAAGIGARDGEMEEELVRRLVVAVQRRVKDRPDLFLSLSGGWDSAALAGLLADTVPSGSVRCFSYVKGQAKPGSDPFVARELARELGFEHEMYQSYRGNLVAHIRRNARWGMGTAHPVDEVHAWEALAADVGTASHPVLLVGDHYLGQNRVQRMKNKTKPLGKMKEFHRLRWLAPHLGGRVYRRLLDGMRSDLDAVRGGAGPNRTGGYYFFDQRLPNTVVPWRSQFPGRFMQIRWPLLDYDLLDWTQMISLDQRRSCIYQRTVERALPGVFRAPRANVQGYQMDLASECLDQSRQLKRAFIQKESRLDEVLPPDLGNALISLVHQEARLPGKILRQLRSHLESAQLATRRKLGMSTIGKSVRRARVLRNYLILRQALSTRPQR